MALKFWLRSGVLRTLASVFLVVAAAGSVNAVFGQKVVDKTVATVSDGVRTEVILYSDLLWQLALQPNVPLAEPRSDDLNRALDTLIDQRLFALEALRLPRSAPSDEEVQAEIRETLSHFPSTADFEQRLRAVGFSSVKDDDFESIIARRVAINNYIDFRFRSFVVVTADEESRYYGDVFTPDFQRRYPGVVLPSFESQKTVIHDTLVEDKVAARIESFLDDAKRRDEIVILTEL